MITYRRCKHCTALQLEELFSSVGWHSAKYPERLALALSNSSRVVSAWDGQRLVGLIRGQDDGCWQACIDCLLVSPAYQGQGVGSALLNTLIKEYADFLSVDVVPEEKKNVAFYEKFGFHVMEAGTPLQWRGNGWK